MTGSVNSLKTLNKGNENISKTDLYSVAPELLLEEEGFNSRGAFCEDYFERPEIAEGIERIADAYTRGDFVPPIVVKVKDGKVFVRDGHRRRRGLLLAISRGAPIKKVQVIEHKGDEAEQTALICSSNEGLPLTPLERAVVYGRLNTWGWSDQEIADKVGRSAEHVRITRGYLELPIELKKMVQREEVAATYAAELYKEHGEAALDVLKKAIDDQPKDAKKKVTKKKVQTGPRLGKKVVAQMHKSVSSIAGRLEDIKDSGDGETFTLTLSKADVEDLQALKAELAALEGKTSGKSGEDSEEDKESNAA